MIKRTFKLIGGILAVIFLPYLLGYPVIKLIDYSIDYHNPTHWALQWEAGWVIPLSCILIYLIVMMVYNYIKYGDI